MDAAFPLTLERYADATAGLPNRDPLLKADLLIKEFIVFKSDGLEIYYAPFDFVNAGARVVMVGITPGWTEMEVGFRQASAVLRVSGPTPVA